MSDIFVTRMKYLTSESCDADSIFEGYDELHAITFSHSLSRIEHVMRYFRKGEVIIGCADLLGPADAKLLAMQEYAVNYAYKNDYLLRKINTEEFKLYVLGNIVSHQKIYLLRAYDGRVRTILTSANFSNTAWDGRQLENYVICDDAECYETYMSKFVELRDGYCDPIVKHGAIIDEDGENLGDLPIMKRIEKQGVVLLDVTDTQKEDIEYGFFMDKAKSSMAKLLSQAKRKHDKQGLLEISAEKASKMKAAAKKESIRKKETRKQFPQLVLDWDNYVITYNGKFWDLNPTDKEVEHDAKLLAAHMAGFNPSLFTGDIERLKTIYWKVLNYMFLSPFIARIRYDVANNDGNGDDNWLRFVPMYLLISGASDAGKTKFVKLVTKMMFGKEQMPGFLDEAWFTKARTDQLKADTKGYPIIIDEVTSRNWRYAPEIVKNDMDLIENYVTDHPCFILTSNPFNSVKPEITKRVLVMNLANRMIGDKAVVNGDRVTKIRNGMTNALYRRYAGLMLGRLSAMLGAMKSDGGKFDPWEISSRTLCEILHRCNVLPELGIQTWRDYVGDKTRAERALLIVVDEWSRNPKAFRANRKYNKLHIDFGEHEPKEGQKLLACLCDELPADCDCHRLSAMAVLNLTQIEAHTGISFEPRTKMRLFSKK